MLYMHNAFVKYYYVKIQTYSVLKLKFIETNFSTMIKRG